MCVSPLYRTVRLRAEREERGVMGLVPLCFVLLLAMSQWATAAVEDGMYLVSFSPLQFFVHGSSISWHFFGFFWVIFC